MGRGGDGRGGGDSYRRRYTVDKRGVLDMSKRDLTDDQLRQKLPEPGPYEEVNFSMNSLSSEGLRMVVDLCLQCDKLRVLKLFKNTIDDRGADDLARLCAKCGTLEELHLSHNNLTGDGIGRIVRMAEKHRSDNAPAPLWMRLEMNDVLDPGRYLEELEEASISVCRRRDEVRCTPRRCAYGCKVHLPHFEMQKSTRGKGKGKDWHKADDWESKRESYRESYREPYRESYQEPYEDKDKEDWWEEEYKDERRGEDRRDWNGRDWNAEEAEDDIRKEVVEEIRPNPASILLAGIVAPMQLRWMLSSSDSTMLYSGVMLATAVAIIILQLGAFFSSQTVGIAVNMESTIASWCQSFHPPFEVL